MSADRRCAGRSPRSASPARWRTSSPRPPPPGSTASRSSNPTCSPRRGRPRSWPPAAPTSACRSTSTSRSGTWTRPIRSASPATCAVPSASSTSWPSSAPTPCWSAPRSRPTPSPTSTCSPDSSPPLPTWPPTAGCGSPTRRSPGDGTSPPGTGSWDAVRRADHPALGLCLDSFHVLSRDGDPAGFADVPGENCSSSSWPTRRTWTWTSCSGAATTGSSPGRAPSTCPASSGTCSPPGTPGRCRSRSSTTSSGRPTRRGTAVDAMRSLLWLEEALAVRRPDLGPAAAPPAPALTGHAFTELAVDGVSGPEVAERADRARASRTPASTAPSRSSCGSRAAPGCCSTPRSSGRRARARPRSPRWAWRAPIPAGRRARAGRCCAPVLPRTRGVAEADLSAVAAPDGTQVFFARTRPDGWPADFLPTGRPPAAGPGITAVDHVALTQPFDSFDEAGAVLPLGARAGAGQRSPSSPHRSAWSAAGQ